MKKNAFFQSIAVLLMLFWAGSFAQPDSSDVVNTSVPKIENSDTLQPIAEQANTLNNLRISGFGWMEFGQIMHGWYGNEELDHRWQERFETRLDLCAPVSKDLEIDVGTEIWYQYSTTVAQTNGPSYFPGINVIIDRADLNYSPLKGSFPLSIQAGYFKFKYNPEARNLGEYLFRSGCYPTYVTNNFDFAMNRLLGLNVAGSILKDNDVFSMDYNLLVTSETELYPYEDVSLAGLVAMNVWRKCFTLGLGLDGSRMFSVDEKNTTPHNNKSISEITDVRPAIDQNGNPITVGDTSYYSFAGTKFMARATFDAKQFIPVNIFGEEDLKLYGELAILGLKNYPVRDSSIRYDILSERMPVMVGFNIPTFKFLDVLSFEWEYLNNRYYNSYYNEILGNGTRLPLPYIQARGDQTGIDSSWVGNVKWSFYAKKSIGKNVQIVAQVARDHRHAYVNMSDPRYGDYGDNLTTAKDWYYLIKVAYGF